MKHEDSHISYKPADLVDHDGVMGIIKDNYGRILMQDHVKFNFWTIPIGKADPGESPEDALDKEIEEECAIKVKGKKLLDVKPHSYVRWGNKVTVTKYLYEILDFEGEIKNSEPEKHRELKFMTIDEIMKLNKISDGTILYLKLLGLNRGKYL